MPVTPVGKVTPLVGSDDFCIRCRNRHFRIRGSDARRLLAGKRDCDVYSLAGYTRQGSILAGKEFYRLKLDFQPAFSHMNRFNLLIDGTYWFAPINSWSREAARL